MIFQIYSFSAKCENHSMDSSSYRDGSVGALSIGKTYSCQNVSAKCGNHLMETIRWKPFDGYVVVNAALRFTS